MSAGDDDAPTTATPPAGAASPSADDPTRADPPAMDEHGVPEDHEARYHPHDDEGRPPPMVDFSTFVLSLATNAVINLTDESHDGRIAGSKINLGAAAQHIDLLSMLEEKTRGNLSDDERQLLQTLLYDLRMQYLEAASRRR